MSKTRIVIVGCGFPQLSLLRRAKHHGLHVIGADFNAQAVGVPQCDDFALVSTSDVDALCALVAKSEATAIASTGSEVSVRATAAVAERLQLPFYADTETVRRCQEKDEMRAGYERGGVAIPPYARCHTLAQAQAFVERQGLPVVVKPSRGWGQRGVARVDTMDQLAEAFAAALEHATAAGLPMVVVEGFLRGLEYSVNGWIENGRLESYCVTERLTVPGRKPLGVMVAELYPSGLSAVDEARVVEEARRGAASLGHTRGPCYSQVVLGPDGCFLFETAARMGGGFDADVTKLASGIDLYDRILGVALADRALESVGVQAPKHGAAVAKFLIGKPGRVRSATGLPEARAMAGIVDAEYFVPVGGIVHPLTDSAKRAGYVLAHADTRQQVLERADAALAAMHLDTVDERSTQPQAIER